MKRREHYKEEERGYEKKWVTVSQAELRQGSSWRHAGGVGADGAPSREIIGHWVYSVAGPLLLAMAHSGGEVESAAYEHGGATKRRPDTPWPPPPAAAAAAAAASGA